MKRLTRLLHPALKFRWPLWLRTLRMACLLALTAGSTQAADLVWDNVSGTFVWNTTDLNWGGAAWNNAAGNGAIFGATGAGVIDVASAINLNSINFTANGYTLNGAGSLNFVSGTSTLGFGFMNVAPSVTATVNTAISSTYIIKLGAGVLELGGPMNFTGNGLSIDPRGMLPTDLIVGGGSDNNFNPILGGTIRILNTGVLPVTTRLGLANGLIDLGTNNITIAALNFVNAGNNTAGFNPATGVGGVGVFGTGTLRVTGEINVLGRNTGNFNSNSIGSNLDLGGGTQVVRVASNGAFMSSGRALQFTGVLSNGSLLKTFGYQENGIMGNPDGIALHGNNTYTGSSTFNGGQNIITGTNATTSVRIVGDRGLGAPSGSALTLQGANGSLGSATTIAAVAGGTFVIDNTASLPAGGDTPTVLAAQNNNRIRDDAEIQLRDASFLYRGLAATAASETFGNLNLQGGYNNVTLTPGSGGGTVSVTASGNLTLAPRATLQVTSPTLGAASKFFINGTMPAADATGILSRVVGSTDFLTYNGTTGLTPYTGYATDFTTAGTNVFTNAAASVATSVNVNAVKSTGSFITTLAAGQTLGVDSGMMLNLTGTRTYTGGTIAFGANPGTFFAGSVGAGGTTINSAITGTNGLINTNSATLLLNGDLSGLTGTITNGHAFATTTLATNTFAGAIEVRGGQFNINTSQTLAGQGAITMGVAANDAHLINNFQNLSIAGAGNGAIMGRDIIVDNGSNDAAGLATTFGFIPVIAPINNNLGSQTLSGNITLNSLARLQGGSGAGMGSTTLSGNISGPAQFFLSNGRDLLTGNYSNAGGFRVGEGGFTSQVSFLGTAVGNAPINMIGGNSTFIAYNANSLPTGQITVEGTNASGLGTTASINPLQNSTINNAIFLGSTINPGTVLANVANGVTANWTGPISGAGGLIKTTGTGTLNLSGLETYTGATSVNAGTLGLDYSTNNTTKLADGAALNLGGGTLNLSGGSHTEVVASTTLNFGASSVTRSSGSSVLQMNGITRTIGSTLNFGASNIANTDTNNAGGFGILGGYATVGGTTGSADWAKSTNSGAADTAITAFTTYDSFATSGSDNNNPLLTGSSALTGDLTTNSLKINTSGAGQSLDVVAGQTLTLNTGGLLFTGAQDYQINNGTLKSNSAANAELMVQQYGAGNLTINSVIANGTSTSSLTKAGDGTLTLGAAANTYTGANIMNAGTLVINGSNAATQNVISGGTMVFNSSSASTQNIVNGGTIVFNGSNAATSGNTINGGTMLVNGTSSGTTTVNSGGTLGGTGSLTSAVTVQSGGTLSPGSSIGTFAIGAGTGRQLTLSGTFLAEINLNNGGAPSADLLNLTGTFGITGGILQLSVTNLPASGVPQTFLIAANDGTDAISGTFLGITGLPDGYSATVNYAFTGTDSLGRVGTGNDVAVTVVVPEPQTYALFAVGGAFLLWHLARRRTRGAVAVR